MAKNCDPRNGKATTTKLVLAKCPKITCRKSYIGSSCVGIYTCQHFHTHIEVAWFWLEMKWAGTLQQDYSPTRCTLEHWPYILTIVHCTPANYLYSQMQTRWGWDWRSPSSQGESYKIKRVMRCLQKALSYLHLTCYNSLWSCFPSIRHG